MPTDWFVRGGGKVYGPLDSSKLRQLAAGGKIDENTEVAQAHNGPWVPASRVKGLFTRPMPTEEVPRAAAIPDPPAFVAAPVAAAPPAVPQAVTTISLPINLHLQRLAVAITSGLGLLATFLPWVHAPIVGAIYGTRGDGWITFVLFLPAMVLSFLGDRVEPFRGWRRFLSAVPAAIASLICVSKLVMMAQKMSDVPKDNPFASALASSVQIGIGIYLVIAAGIAVAVLTFVLSRDSK